MSFGFSFGDVVSASQLAWNVYTQYKEAPGQYKDASAELKSLTVALREFEDVARAPTPAMKRCDDAKQQDMKLLLQNIMEVLSQLQDILKSYKSLGRSEKKTWDRLRFAQQDWMSLRQRIIVHMEAINVFLASVNMSVMVRIEDKIDDMLSEIRSYKRAPTILSICAVQVVESAVGLDALQKELSDEGISSEIVYEYRQEIKELLQAKISESEAGGGSCNSSISASSLVDALEELDPSDSISQIATAQENVSSVSHENMNKPTIESATAFNIRSLPPSEERFSIAEKRLLHFQLKSTAKPIEVPPANPPLLTQTTIEMQLDAVVSNTSAIDLCDASGSISTTALTSSSVEISNPETEPRANSKISSLPSIQTSPGELITARNNIKLKYPQYAKSFIDRQRALEEAVEKNNQPAISVLIQAGADINDGKGASLWRAVNTGNLQSAARLIANGANVTLESASGKTPLHLAASTGNPNMIQLLVENGAQVDAQCSTSHRHGWISAENHLGTPLMHAVRAGNRNEVVELLLQLDADIEHLSLMGRPLHAVILLGIVDILKMIELLVEKGANIEGQCERHGTPLQLAVRYKRLAIVQKLIQLGADPNTLGLGGNTCLHYAVQAGDLRMVKCLAALGATTEIYNDDGLTPFLVAVKVGALIMVEALLDLGASMYASGPQGTALHIAAAGEFIDVVRLLKWKGLDMDAVDDAGLTPIAWTIKMGKFDFARSLCTLSAHSTGVDHPDAEGYTSLAHSVKNGNLWEVNNLIDLGACVDTMTEDGSLLHLAIDVEDISIAEALLEAGADVNASFESADGLKSTPLLKAAKIGREGMVSRLLKHGADPEIMNEEGLRALHLTAQCGQTRARHHLMQQHKTTFDESESKYLGTLSTLLDAGVDINARGHDGHTALWEACQNGHAGIVELLLANGADQTLRAPYDQALPFQIAAMNQHFNVTTLADWN